MSVEKEKLIIVKYFNEYVKSLPKELSIVEYMVKQNEFLIDRLATEREENKRLLKALKDKNNE